MSDFKDVFIPDVTFVYPRVNQLYRYDPHYEMTSEGKRGKTVPATPQDQGAHWGVNFTVSKEMGRKIYKEAADHFKAREPNKTFSGIFGQSQTDDGEIMFRARKNARNAKGQDNKAPMVIDGSKNPLEQLDFWSGSKGAVKVTMRPSFNPRDNTDGVSLMLHSLQVTDAIYGGNGMDDYDVVDSPAASNGSTSVSLGGDDPFGLPEAPKQSQSRPSNDLDDEIPF